MAQVVKTGGSLAGKVVFWGVVIMVAPYIVNRFMAWLWPLIPGLATAAVVIVALLGLTTFFITRLRRNAAR